jgi:hypothetical protein
VDNQSTRKFAVAKGKRGPDDDLDTERIPNRVEDKNLNSVFDAHDLYDWNKYRTGGLGTPANILNDFEDWNCQRNRSAFRYGTQRLFGRGQRDRRCQKSGPQERIWYTDPEFSLLHISLRSRERT